MAYNPVVQRNAVTDDRVADRRRVSGLHVGAQLVLATRNGFELRRMAGHSFFCQAGWEKIENGQESRRHRASAEAAEFEERPLRGANSNSTSAHSFSGGSG